MATVKSSAADLRQDVANGVRNQIRLFDLNVVSASLRDDELPDAREVRDSQVIRPVLCLTSLTVSGRVVRQTTGDHDERQIAKRELFACITIAQVGELLQLEGIVRGRSVLPSLERPASHRSAFGGDPAARRFIR